MPKVGDKEYDYDEEGMEEAEAEAAETGQDVQMADDSFVEAIEKAMTAPEEGAEGEAEPEEEPEVEAEEEPEVEAEEEPEVEGGEALFMELFGEEFDPEDEEHQEQMKLIITLMEDNPEATPAELATKFIRGNVVLAD